MKVNIVLITKDRPKLVVQTLISMMSTCLKPHLTILDDHSKNEASDLIAHCCPLMTKRGWEINYIIPAFPLGGSGPARNYAIQSIENRGDFLYCSDNDVFFHPGWLEALISHWRIAKKLGFALLGAYNHPFNQTVSERGGIIENLAVASQSWFMEWSTWDRFGPLADNKGVRQSEDVEFCNKIRAAGFMVGKLPAPWAVNTGVTDSYGVEIPGADYVRKEIPVGIYYE